MGRFSEPRASISYRQEIDGGKARFSPTGRKFRQNLLDMPLAYVLA